MNLQNYQALLAFANASLTRSELREFVEALQNPTLLNIYESLPHSSTLVRILGMSSAEVRQKVIDAIFQKLEQEHKQRVPITG